MSFHTFTIQDPSGTSRQPIQPKLTIGAPNDPYEQEADRVASQVVQHIHAPSANPAHPSPAVQRLAMPEEDELQMKPLLQRKALEEDELQMQPMLQRLEMTEEDELQMKPASLGQIVAGEASPYLETGIQQARGSGQALAPDLQAKIGHAMGADFSNVRIHTDSQSDQLNRSIQAKAFTTGQDIFFRQGAYQPGSRGGQELIAHELTHVVQQKGATVQRSGASGNLNSDAIQEPNIPQNRLEMSMGSILPKPSTSSNVPPSIQAAFEVAYVNDTAQLHRIDPTTGKDKGTVSGGKKLRSGDEVEADETATIGEWTKAKAAGKDGYLRKSKIVLKRTLTGVTDPKFQSDSFEVGQNTTDTAGGFFDGSAGTIEQSSLKTIKDGRLHDREDASSGSTTAKTGLDITAGVGDTFSGLLGLAANFQAISKDKSAWDNFAAGFGFVQSLGKATSGSTKIVDSIAKISGSEKGVGKSDVAGKVTGAIADGLSAVKDAALGIIGIYRLFKSQSDEKKKDALVTFQSFTNAAASAAKVAKSAYDIIGKGIPMSVVYTVPALSIGVSAINALVRLWDAITADKTKSSMGQLASPLRITLASTLGDTVPTEDNVKDSKVFDKDRRGTFPNYKTYFRIKKDVRESIKQISELAQERSKNLGDVARDSRQDRSVAKRAHVAVKAKITSSTLNAEVKKKLEDLTGTPRTVVEFRDNTVKPLEDVDQQIDTYEYADKMSEINKKRKTSGWTDVILELVSMAGDITTIAVGATGIGAAIGQSIKLGAGAYRVGHSSAKFIQKIYRDSGDGSDKKSSQNKHREYVGHAKFIYQQVATLKPGDTAKADQTEQLIRATGVNYGMWLAERHNPKEQVEMLVEAMKKR
ncbi:MAG: DUF4157 domain-containing protein [Spirulina sp.]